jgi:tRNA dimethylallyltransferase
VERKVILIAGPTCSGKTSLSIILATKLHTEILSADSRQFYKYLNIGTAKPDKHTLDKVKHHFIDFLEPDERFNASIYEKQALKVIEELFEQNKIPVVVGGSGLYIKAIMEGIFDEVKVDEKIRKKLLRIKEKKGNEGLYNVLKKVDPVSASKMFPRIWKRVLRALEVYYQTGQPIWKFHKIHNRDIDIYFRLYCLNWNRDVLYANIEDRVDKMISNGLIEEIKYILDKGYSKSLNSLNTVGYKEIISYLEGNITLERAVELIKRNTRRYAKRQMTWFRKVDGINWIDVSSFDDLERISEEIIKAEGLNER